MRNTYETSNARSLVRFCSAIIPLILFSVSAVQAQWVTNNGKTTTTDDVGIGTTSPQALLNVHKATADGTSVQLAITGGVTGDRDLDFRGVHVSSDGSNKILGRIRLTGDGSFAQSGELGFFTGQNDGSNNITLSERLRIKSNGNVGIGTTSPNASLHLNGTDNQLVLSSSGNRGLEIGTDGTTATILGYNRGTSAYKQINYNGSFHTLSISGTEKVRIDTSGNVGIGTTNPGYKLEVNGSIKGDTISINPSFGLLTYAGGMFAAFNVLAHSGKALSLGSNDVYDRMVLDTNGNVGIGTTSPSTKLEVNGTISGTNVVAKYQDVAEWVPASEQLSAGTVVVLDSTKSNQVTSSTTSYDTRVAGVVSEQPGIELGEKSEGKVLVATTGRVRVKVDASKGPIHIGDLLVTSDVPGVAMKSEAVNLGGVQFHRPGTLIGKALEPLEKGKGEILVLLSLQ